MANTFKVKTKAGIGTSITTVYTVPSSTTAIVLGLIVGNVTGSVVNATVHVETNTSDTCLLYTSPSPRDKRQSRMPSSA